MKTPREVLLGQHQAAEPELDAIREQVVAGLATDVFATEPPAQRKLAAHPRVIATPHLGGFTQESVSRAMDVAVDNLLAGLAGPASPSPQ